MRKVSIIYLSKTVYVDATVVISHLGFLEGFLGALEPVKFTRTQLVDLKTFSRKLS